MFCIPCEFRIDFCDVRFTGVSMEIATRGLAVVILISGPGRDKWPRVGSHRSGDLIGK